MAQRKVIPEPGVSGMNIMEEKEAKKKGERTDECFLDGKGLFSLVCICYAEVS